MSYDVKYRKRALEYWSSGHTQTETAKVFAVSAKVLQNWRNQLKSTGKLEPKTRRETWRKIDPERLNAYMQQHPDAYLKEIAEEFGCSDVAIIKALRRLKISRKKTTAFRERDESFRQAFVETVKNLPAHRLVYVDECGIEQCLYREYARAPRGQKVVAKISGKKFRRSNIVAGICQNEWVAPMEYSGITDSILFEYWFENCLLREVEHGSIIILDNATFHRKFALAQLAECYDCEVLFLPPYSPDLNPIEKKWAWLKRELRKILPTFDSFTEALFSTFQVS